MKKQSISAISILLVLFTVFVSCKNEVANDATQSEEYIISGNGFSVTFPDSVSMSIENVPTDAGNFKLTTYQSASSDNAVYTLTASVFPDSLVKKDKTAALLENAKEQALIKCGMSTGIEENKVDINGNPGIWFKTKKDMDTVVYYTEYKMYFVNNTLYQMGAMQRNAWPEKKRTDEFMNSFKLQN